MIRKDFKFFKQTPISAYENNGSDVGRWSAHHVVITQERDHDEAKDQIHSSEFA